jgi:hypothetical protein
MRTEHEIEIDKIHDRQLAEKDAEIERLKTIITSLVDAWYSEPQQYRGDSITELLKRAREDALE